MEWFKLERIPIVNLNFMQQQHAKVLNDRMEKLEELRAYVDAPLSDSQAVAHSVEADRMIQIIARGGKEHVKGGKVAEHDVAKCHETLHRLRKNINHYMTTRNPIRPGEPVDEAMRRELILRHDVLAFCRNFKIDPPAGHAEGMASARKFLDSRGTHTSEHRGGR